MKTKKDYEHAAEADMREKMTDGTFYRPVLYETPFGLLQITARHRAGQLFLDMKWLDHELRRLGAYDAAAERPTEVHLRRVQAEDVFELYGLGHSSNCRDALYCRGTYHECVKCAHGMTGYRVIDHT